MPPGFFSLEGQVLPIAGNNGLFNTVGTQYGGDGVNNFVLPNLVGVSPVGRPLTQTDVVTGQLLVEFPVGSGNFIPANQFSGTAAGNTNLSNLPNNFVVERIA